MAALSPGMDVESHCARCKMDLMHVVVAMVGVEPRRVRCRTCGAEHAYLAPQRSRASARPTPRTAAPARAAKPRKTRAPEIDTSRSRPYRAEQAYREGEVVHHLKFGYGVVERRLSNEKIEVRFALGPRLLIMNRAAQ